MTRIGRLTAVLAVLATVLGLSLVSASPAMAYGRRPASCNTATLCFYVHKDFVDGPGRLTESSRDLGVYPHKTCDNDTWDQCISSFWNATNRCWHLHDIVGYRGGYHNLAPNDGYTNMETQSSLNDDVSSVRRGSTGSCAF
jgi:hypothetical protein